MALPSESWMQEFNAATKLADEIGGMVSDTNSLSSSDSVSKRHLSAARRKITILRAKLDTLQSLLIDLPSKQPMSDKEMNRRRDKLKILISKANQMASTLNMSIAPDRDSLFGPDKKSEDLMSKAAGLDNRGVLGLQQQVMKEQDEGLEKLEETVLSTKHIAMAVNEELNLHTRLLDDLDEHVDVTNSHLQRVQRNLGILNKRMNGGCACLMLMVIAVVILVVAAWLLIKYL